METSEQIKSLMQANSVGQNRSYMRQWVYDTGAAMCTIGRNLLTEREIQTIETISPSLTFVTANGPTSCSETVWIKVLHLGFRKVHIVEDCSPLMSVGEDVCDYGNVFY